MVVSTIGKDLSVTFTMQDTLLIGYFREKDRRSYFCFAGYFGNPAEIAIRQMSMPQQSGGCQKVPFPTDRA